jgi:hypothetical protein
VNPRPAVSHLSFLQSQLSALQCSSQDALITSIFGPRFATLDRDGQRRALAVFNQHLSIINHQLDACRVSLEETKRRHHEKKCNS